jgi:ABC-type sulfate/molybdate transport systems ATPase subunit
MSLEVSIHKKLDGFSLDVSFTAEPGVTALLGASGSGKSMTLRCIAGVEKPDAGGSFSTDACSTIPNARSIYRRSSAESGICFNGTRCFPT